MELSKSKWFKIENETGKHYIAACFKERVLVRIGITTNPRMYQQGNNKYEIYFHECNEEDKENIANDYIVHYKPIQNKQLYDVMTIGKAQYIFRKFNNEYFKYSKAFILDVLMEHKWEFNGKLYVRKEEVAENVQSIIDNNYEK